MYIYIYTCFPQIRILQETLTNDLLSDHEQGVLCQVEPQRVLDILRQNGFNLQKQENEEEKTSWTVVKDGEGGEKPDASNPTPNNENEGEGDGEEQGGGDGGDEGEDENKEGEGEGEEEQEQE